MSEQSKKIPCCTGLLAHVDAGKTTLSEALLYVSGARRTLGRVDHADAYLDTHFLERQRGITIFSKQALFSTPHRDITLMDTPGHVDFCAEAERVLPVLDCAVLVISGPSGVQAHTVTLWDLLRRYRVPTVLFVSKMDLPGADRQTLMGQLQQQRQPEFQLEAGGNGLNRVVSMASVADYEFDECYNLHRITLPKNIKRIGNSAFYGRGRSSTEMAGKRIYVLFGYGVTVWIDTAIAFACVWGGAVTATEFGRNCCMLSVFGRDFVV